MTSSEPNRARNPRAGDAAPRLAELAAQYDLAPAAATQLGRLLDLVAAEHASITTVRDPAAAADAHVADSLVALRLPQVAQAGALADLGAGGGFPGLVLAVALPATAVIVVESVERKCRFMRAAADELGLGNVAVVCERAEAWRDGAGSCDVVTARALAPLPVLAEYAAPLLVDGGALVAWKADVEDDEAAAGDAAASLLGMSALERVPVQPFAAARSRALYVGTRIAPLPAGFPRRPGIARKRPLGMDRARDANVRARRA